MPMSIRTCLAALAAILAWPAHAELKQSAADGFEVVHVFDITAKREAAWDVLLAPARYWPKAHTWSGDPSHLAIEAKADGCFCERWKGGESQHARVLMVVPRELLRMNGALGPLQSMAVTGVLSIELADGEAGHTKATVTYRVSGDSLHQLDKLAPVVDTVLGQQFGRFATLASGGKLAE